MQPQQQQQQQQPQQQEEEEDEEQCQEYQPDAWHTLAAVAGNVLEWYDFAVFGYFSDILGSVFFPANGEDDNGDQQHTMHTQTVKSFAVFGGAFLMRPIGGILMGYIGDRFGSQKALVYSIFLMAFPTFAMGCLPTYDQVGVLAIVLLVVVRLLQGLSVGGQLMSSLVVTLESRDPSVWGLYGSFVMAAANCGTLLGGCVGFVLRESLNERQLLSYGWRIPFWSGIFVSLSGFYLKAHPSFHQQPSHHHQHHHHQHYPIQQQMQHGNHYDSAKQDTSSNGDEDEHDSDPATARTASADAAAMNTTDSSHIIIPSFEPPHPLRVALSGSNLRPLLAASLVPMLWAAGFYVSFVWMAIYMQKLLEPPVPHAFAINAAALFLSVCAFFPVAGSLSDRVGRIPCMTVGGIGMAILAPTIVHLIGKWTVHDRSPHHRALAAFFGQCSLGLCLSLYGAPMCAWLFERFDPVARLTSVGLAYNIANSLAGGISPALATYMLDSVSPTSPGWILTVFAILSLTGLLCVAPTTSAAAAAAGGHHTALDVVVVDAAAADNDDKVGTAAGDLEMTQTTTRHGSVSDHDENDDENHHHHDHLEDRELI